MINDIWYLGKGHWATYTEDSSIAEQLHNLTDVHLVTVYRHIKKNDILAMQFTFYDQGLENHQQQSILSVVCSIMGLDFKRVLLLKQRGDSLPYSRRYLPKGDQVQLPFNVNGQSTRKVKKRKKTSH
ncbi:hypothetical protein V6C27_07875 [Peptococcaceae bacterium 1198_IL3148]